MSDRLHALAELVNTAEDASYLWLKLKCVVQDCSEVNSCVCYMPAKKHFKESALKSPYECLQDDILQVQGRGADNLVCGDMSAGTAEHDDRIRLSELPPCLDVLDEADDLPDHIQPKHNCDKIWDPSKRQPKHAVATNFSLISLGEPVVHQKGGSANTSVLNSFLDSTCNSIAITPRCWQYL